MGTEKFPVFKKYQFIDPKSSTQPSKISIKKTTRGHNITKLVKTSDKIFKEAREKDISYKKKINSAVFQSHCKPGDSGMISIKC